MTTIDDEAIDVGSLVPPDDIDFQRSLRLAEKEVTEGAIQAGFAQDKTDRSYQVQQTQHQENGLENIHAVEEHPLVKPNGITPKNLEHAASENAASLDELEAKPEQELSPELRYQKEQKLQQRQEKAFNPQPTNPL